VHLAVTMHEIVADFVAGAASGLSVIAQSPLLERIFYPLVVALQTIPKVVVAPFVVIWFGCPA
jgi:NitT/TauT family transport system permease protein